VRKGIGLGYSNRAKDQSKLREAGGGVEEGKDGRMERWKGGRGEGWKGGRMEGWKRGRGEGWNGGRMERWKDGRMEEGKDGRMEEESSKRCGRSKILGQRRTKGKEKRRFVREKMIDILLAPARRARVAMVQRSRMVTIIEGVEVTETTAYDRDGNPMETFYRVKGEKFETLKQAMEAARSDREGGPTG
jgi:hypothetical protein